MELSAWRSDATTSEKRVTLRIMELSVILAGLAASLSWGVGDFSGGLASRKAPVLRVVLASQLIGTSILILLGLASGEALPGTAELLLYSLGGVAGAAAVPLFYLSMARGKMGVAAPLTALASGGIPLLVGLLTEGLPSSMQLGGFALALAALWLIARPGNGEPVHLPDVWMPLLAGLGFGIYLTILGRADPSGGFIWPLATSRLVSIVLLSGIVLGTSRRKMPRREVGAFPWPLTALSALGDMGGYSLFTIASQLGRLDVAAVLSSLYPAVTALLAWWVLRERLAPRQTVGVVMALLAVAMIAL